MTSATKLFAALSAVLVLILAYVLIIERDPSSLTKAQVETMVAQAVADHAIAVQKLDPTIDLDAAPVVVASNLPNIDLPSKNDIYPMFESYLLENPEILTLASQELERRENAAQSAEQKIMLADLRDDIYNGSENVILGNPDGDVTLVELFDYNCGYCKRALGDMLALLDEDPQLRIILKEFPILSQESVDAARIAVLVNQSDADYLAFHSELLTQRGQVDSAKALQAAANVGLNPLDLELRAGEPRTQQAIDATYKIANALRITGTPAYILGDEIIPGAIGKQGLKDKIAAIRAASSIN